MIPFYCGRTGVLLQLGTRATSTQTWVNLNQNRAHVMFAQC